MRRLLIPKILLPVSDLTNFWTVTDFFWFDVGLQNQFDGEVQTRIEREKDIMQEVDNSKYNLQKKIDAERTDKSLKLGAYKDECNQKLKQQHKYIEEFQREAMAEFMRLREQLEHEMDERFDQQDEIIDSLSQSIKTFQDTMKIVGDTVC